MDAIDAVIVIFRDRMVSNLHLDCGRRWRVMVWLKASSLFRWRGAVSECAGDLLAR